MFRESYRLHALRAALVLLSLLAAAAYFLFERSRSAPSAGSGKSLGAELSAEFAPLPVDADQLFLPAEPDLLPAAILAREPRSAWTADEAAAFWTDPSVLDPAPLDAAVDAVVDSMLAEVP